MRAATSQEPTQERDLRAVVLVVDDEKGPRESLRMILSSRYRVLTSDGVNAALEILRSRAVDLVTVDLNMPGIRGHELVGIMGREFPGIEIIIITGCATVDAAVEGIRSGVADFLTKPFDVVQVTAAVARALDQRSAPRRSPSEERQTRSSADRKPITDAPTLEFFETLAETISSRDPAKQGHARRVSFYASLIADRMNLEPTLREHTRIAGLLHDLGKPESSRAGVPVAQEHSIRGNRLLESLGLPKTITSAVRHHRERWDGAGFPSGLLADSIPLIARIIAVADSFDSIVCKQSSSPHEERRVALAELDEAAGSQLDPEIVGVFCEIAEIQMPQSITSAAPSPAELTHAFYQGADGRHSA